MFDKVFADLRANHPADEWTLRLVDQLPSAVKDVSPTEAVTENAAAPESEAAELMVLEQLGVTDVVTSEEEDKTVEVVELAHYSPTSLPQEGEKKVVDDESVTNTEPVDQGDASVGINQPVDDVHPPDQPDCGGSLTQEVQESVVDAVPIEEVSVEAEVVPEVAPAVEESVPKEPEEENQPAVEQAAEEGEQEKLDAEQSSPLENESDNNVAEQQQPESQVTDVKEEPEPVQETTTQVVRDDENTAETEAIPVQETQSAQLEETPKETGEEPVSTEPTVELSVEIETPKEVSALIEVFNHDGTPVEAPKQVEEVEVKPPQLPEQPPSASSPNLAKLGASKSTPSTPTSKKKRPTSPASGEPTRKPEWMRRPLVRKGSVGRFLGRMKETMQSKRFGPDRLPVVPPPELPPKRPPRRKTLANLDLNRESVTVNGEQTSQVDSPAPPPTPKSASHNNSISVDLEMSKSATLRSSTSDGRKRRNSVGRLAASAASRISRALSIKNLNSSDAASVTTAEAAPLLQQEAPKATTAAPAQPTPSPSTHKTMTIKKDLGQLMRRMDPRPVIDRILAPKTPSAEEGNKNKPLPERPPLPAAAAAKVAPKERKEKPIIKNGKVQFQCQVSKKFYRK